MTKFLTMLFFFPFIIFCGKAHSQTGKSYQDIGDSLYSSKNYQIAADNYSKAMPFYPKDKNKLSELYDSRSECYRKLKLFSIAMNDASTAISLNPHNGGAYWDLAIANSDNGDHKTAIDNYTKAMPFYQDDNESLSSLYDNRADEEGDLKLYKNAITDDSLAIKLNPKNGDAYWHRGIAFNGVHNFQGAIDDYTNAMQYQDDKESLAILYDNRGCCERKLKQYLPAINDESYAIKLDPKSGDEYWHRGLVYAANGDYQLAIDDYTKAMSYVKNDKTELAKLYNNRGFNEIQLRQTKKAIEDYVIAISLNPADGSYYWNRAIDFSTNGEFKFGIDDYTKAMNFYQNDKNNLAILYNNCANNAYFLKDYQGVINYCTIAISLNPKFSSPFYYRGKVYLKKMNKGQMADNDFKKSIELDTTQKSVDFIFSLFFTGNQGLAYKTMQEKLLSTTNNDDIIIDYYNMACLLSLMNKPEEAIVYLKKSIDAGYPKNFALNDDDLDNLRNTKDYINLMTDNSSPAN